VTVIGNVDIESGELDGSMVMDFKFLKSIVKNNIIDIFDHQLILSKKSRFIHLIKENERTMIVDYVPTCENILIDIVKRLQYKLPKGIELFHVFLRETPRSYAEWNSEDNK
jgi:6-pyruvoyltetrahydropterin/6-carboxytetrahydropterin synthase